MKLKYNAVLLLQHYPYTKSVEHSGHIMAQKS